jgi:hypothetical protein
MKKDIHRILDDLADGIEELRDSLEPLGRLFREDMPRRAAAARKRSRKVARTGRRIGRRVQKSASRRLSAGVRELRAMQARYMTVVRALSKSQKERVKKLRESKGYAEALKLAASLRGKK